jgi:signal transduction histidine kinase
MNMPETHLLPLPHFNKKIRYNGSMISWPLICQTCKYTSCKDGEIEKISLCSHGFNYVRINNSITMGGFVLKDFHQHNPARNKRYKEESHNLISIQMLNSVIAVIKETSDFVQEEIEREKNAIIQRYIKKEQFKSDFLSPLKEEIQKGLSFVHDYKQINSQIRQNINVIVERNYSGDSLEDKLLKATREERAIFEASKFLDEKLNVAKFLLHPEWLNRKDECSKFQFHKMILKYRRIYAPRFEAKDIQVRMPGKSYHEIIANAQALSVIPHTFLDNAAKYSLRGGITEIYVQDIENAIEFSVSSFGPIIKPQEREKIFQPFFRTKSAEKIAEEGAGYGLYISQLIAENHLGTQISVKQNPDETPAKGYWTTFSIILPLKATIV